MNFATASLYLTAILTSGLATIGEARLLSKAAKAQACQEALDGFNLAGAINFGSGQNGYIRTMCAGDTFLLTKPEKASKIYAHMCPNADGFAALDAFLLQADEAGGCDDPVAGQPSRALAEYRKCRNDAKVATEMVCADDGDADEETDLCWSVVYQLTKDDCWTSNFTEPVFDGSPSNCLPLRKKTENVDGTDVDVHVTCDCLSAYVNAYEQFSPEGLASFGANEDTLALVTNRLLDCIE